METSLENMMGYGKKTFVAGLSLLSLLYVGLTTPCCGRGGHSDYAYNSPNIPNNPPVAKALFSHSAPSNQDHPPFVHPRDGVVLDGSCSYDPDGDHISYLWSMNKKPAGSSLTDNDILSRYKPNPVFFPDVEGDYTLELRVTDEKGASALAYITVSVQKNIPIRLQISPTDNLRDLEGNTIKFTAHDPTNTHKTLVYEIINSNIPNSNAHFNQNTGKFSWPTNCNDSGIYTLNVRAKYADGTTSLAYTVTITVDENLNCSMHQKTKNKIVKEKSKKKENGKTNILKKLFGKE